MALGRKRFRPIRARKLEDGPPILCDVQDTQSQRSLEGLERAEKKLETQAPETCRMHYKPAISQNRRRRDKRLENTYGQCLVEGGIPSYSPCGHVESKFFSQSLLLPMVIPRAKTEKVCAVKKAPPPTPAVYQVKSTAHVYDGDEIRLDDVTPFPKGTWILANKLLYTGKQAWLQLSRGDNPNVFYVLAQDAPIRIPPHQANMFGAVKQNINRAAMHRHELALSHALLVARVCTDGSDRLIALAEKGLAHVRSPRVKSPIPRKLSLPPTTLGQCYSVFCRWAKTRFGGLTALWTRLDPERHMQMGRANFFRNCRRLGFAGCSLRLVWKFLDRTPDGVITIFELDPEVTTELVAFLNWLRNDLACGLYSFDEIIPHFCGVDSGIQMKQFMECISTRYRGKIDVLYPLVNLSASQVVTSSDLAFLGRIRGPDYVSAQKNMSDFELFCSLSVQQYGSSFAAWRKMDTEGIMRVCWKSFLTVFIECMGTYRRLNAAAVWKCLDQNGVGWASFYHFDSRVYKIMRDLHDDCIKESGSVVKHLRKLESKKGCADSESDTRDSRCASTPERVDDLFQVSACGEVEPSYFKCLDNWDIAWEESDALKFAGDATRTRSKAGSTSERGKNPPARNTWKILGDLVGFIQTARGNRLLSSVAE